MHLSHCHSDRREESPSGGAATERGFFAALGLGALWAPLREQNDRGPFTLKLQLLGSPGEWRNAIDACTFG
jgi:hypothetical protein